MNTSRSGEPTEPEDLIKLLLVDDEEGYVDVLANRLRRRGMDVTKAYSGAEAIQAVGRENFELIILDLKMEDMDGLEVLRMYNRMNLAAKVIMLTGHGSQRAAREGIRLGAFDYLTKPCELEELLAKIHEAHRALQKKSCQGLS